MIELLRLQPRQGEEQRQLKRRWIAGLLAKINKRTADRLPGRDGMRPSLVTEVTRGYLMMEGTLSAASQVHFSRSCLKAALRLNWCLRQVSVAG